MFNENDVIDGVCRHLEASGYNIVQRCLTTEKGIDIIATHHSKSGRLLIEAKGGTSSDEKTNRYGKDFDSKQVFDRVAKAFYTAGCTYSQFRASGDTVALAFPDTTQFRMRLNAIKPALEELKIGVFLVNDENEVISL